MNRWWRPIILLLLLLPFMGVFAADKSPANIENVRVRTVWTDSGIYFTFVVEKLGVNGKHTSFPSLAWIDDAVAVYFDLNPEGSPRLSDSCRRIVISSAGGAAFQRVVNGEWMDDPTGLKNGKPTFEYAVKVAFNPQDSNKPATGYTVELGLPWDLVVPHLPNNLLRSAVPRTRFALAVYDFANSQPVGIWPADLPLSNGLLTPNKWGQLAFIQAMGVVNPEARQLNAPYLPENPIVDGDAQGIEWMQAGGVNLSFTTISNIINNKSHAQVLAGWYSLEDPPSSSPHAPLEPRCSAATTLEPLYHMEQLTSARTVGMDAFAVALPVNSAERAHTRAALRALVEALRGFDETYRKKGLNYVVLLMPVLDMSAANNIDLQTQTGQLVVQNVLQDFFALVPPQYRLQSNGSNGATLQPVLVTAPGKDVKWDERLFTNLQLNARPANTPALGWLLDYSYRSFAANPHTLAVCSWDAAAGFHQGEGALNAVLIAPGMSEPFKDTLPRLGGEVYNNTWMRANAAQPDFVLLRSWNDYRQGTEVTASTQYDMASLEITRDSIIRQAKSCAGDIKVLRTSLPAVIRPGMTIPFDVLIKNGSMRGITPAGGFGVEYQILLDGVEIARGPASKNVILLEQLPTQLQLFISSQDDKHKPWKPGNYILKIGFTQNSLSGVVFSAFIKTITDFSIPFTVADDGPPVQLVNLDCPSIVAMDTTPAVTLQLRNLEDRKWDNRDQLVCSWRDETGAPLPDMQPQTTSLKDTNSGNVKDVKLTLAQTPKKPGWYTLHADVRRDGNAPISLFDTLVQVTTADLNAEFLKVLIPGEILNADKELAGEVTLRNAGKSPWQAKTTRITWQWLAWDGTPVPDASGDYAIVDAIAPGGETTAKIKILPPPVGYGQFRCVLGVMVDGKRARMWTSPDMSISPIYNVMVRKWHYLPLNLAAYFDDYTTAADMDASPLRANFDGNGNSYPFEEFLPDATRPVMGYQAGYRTGKIDIKAPRFRFADPLGVRMPVVKGSGQTIAWGAASSSAIHLAAATTAAMTAGPAKDYHFIINYVDGNVAATLEISNWLDSPAHGEPVIWKTRHIHTPTGDDWFNSGSVFAYTIPLDSKRMVKGLTLPTDGDLKIFALTLQEPVAE